MPTIDSLKSQFQSLLATLSDPASIDFRAYPFIDLLQHWEGAAPNPVLDQITDFKRSLNAWPEKTFPKEIMDLIFQAISSPDTYPAQSRLRLVWLIDAAASRYPHTEDFVRFWLEREQDADLYAHLHGHTLPQAILLGPSTRKSQAFLTLMQELNPDLLPAAFEYFLQHDPFARQSLPKDLLTKLEISEARQAEVEEELQSAHVAGRFSPERYAAIIAKKHFSAAAALIGPLTQPIKDTDISDLLIEALVGWPEDIDDQLEVALSSLTDLWSPDCLASRACLQSVIDRRSANKFLDSLS